MAFCAELHRAGAARQAGRTFGRSSSAAPLPTCAERAVETLHVHTASVDEVPSLAIAEMAKLLENTFRAVSTAVANDFADIRRSMKVDT